MNCIVLVRLLLEISFLQQHEIAQSITSVFYRTIHTGHIVRLCKKATIHQVTTMLASHFYKCPISRS